MQIWYRDVGQSETRFTAEFDPEIGKMIAGAITILETIQRREEIASKLFDVLRLLAGVVDALSSAVGGPKIAAPFVSALADAYVGHNTRPLTHSPLSPLLPPGQTTAPQGASLSREPQVPTSMHHPADDSSRKFAAQADIDDRFADMSPAERAAVLYDRAVARLRLGKRASALTLVRQCLDCNPGFLPALVLLSKLMADDPPPEVTSDVNDSFADMAPGERAVVLYDLAVKRLRLGKKASAVRLLHQCLECDHQFAPARRLLTQIQSNAGS
jgi:hypothetical protein